MPCQGPSPRRVPSSLADRPEASDLCLACANLPVLPIPAGPSRFPPPTSLQQRNPVRMHQRACPVGDLGQDRRARRLALATPPAQCPEPARPRRWGWMGRAACPALQDSAQCSSRVCRPIWNETPRAWQTGMPKQAMQPGRFELQGGVPGGDTPAISRPTHGYGCSIQCRHSLCTMDRAHAFRMNGLHAAPAAPCHARSRQQSRT